MSYLKKAIGPEQETWITPEDANKILEGNVRNYRKVNKNLVKRYARDMRENQWSKNGGVLSFFQDGSLANGQHRCLAAVQAGKGFWALVYNGVETDRNVDTGTKRTFVDHLRRGGHKNASTLGSIIRVHCEFMRSGLIQHQGGNSSPTFEEMDGQLAKNSDDLIRSTTIMARYTDALPGGRSHFGWIHFAISKVDTKRADEFIADLATSKVPGNPAATLGTSLRRRFNSTRQKPGINWIRACAIKAANAYMADQDLFKIQHSQNSSFPECNWITRSEFP